jgi:hypothetical protein
MSFPKCVFSLVALFFVFIFFSIQSEAGSQNLARLNHVNLDQPGKIELDFNMAISETDIQVEYFRNIIQISLNHSSVYPAKIIPVHGGEISRLFAYQYTPELVRCRLTVDGNAEDYKGRFSFEVNGNKLKLWLHDKKVAQKDTLKVTRASAVPFEMSTGEQELLDEVLLAEEEELFGNLQKARSTSIVPFWWIPLFLVTLIGGGFFVKSLCKRNRSIADIFLKATGVKGKEKFEVLGTHYVGPKKSVTMIRVRNRTLVLGVTDANINALTEFEGGVESEEELSFSETEAPEKFSDMIKDLSARPSLDLSQRVRDEIRRKTVGMKEL